MTVFQSINTLSAAGYITACITYSRNQTWFERVSKQLMELGNDNRGFTGDTLASFGVKFFYFTQTPPRLALAL